MAANRGLQTSSEDQVGGRTWQLCEPCKKKKKSKRADVFCRDCEQYQCSECEKGHEIYDFMSGHDIANVSQPKLDMKGLDKCKIHKREYEFYCVDHQLLCCGTCAMERHRKCNEVNGLLKQVSKTKTNATELISELTEMKTRASSLINRGLETKAKVSWQVDELPGQVDKMKGAVVKIFDRLKDKIMIKAKSVERKLSNELDETCSKSEETRDLLDTSLATLHTVVEQGSPVQIYIAIKVIEAQIPPGKAMLEEKQAEMYTMKFSIEFNDLFTTLLQSEDKTCLLNVDKYYPNSKCGPASRPMRLSLVKSLDLKQTGDDKTEPFYSGTAFLPDGRLVVLDVSNCKCFVMNEKLKKLGKYKFKASPQHLAVISNDKVAVTGGETTHTIHILHVCKKSVATHIQTLNGSSAYASICLMDNSTFVVSTFADKRAVRMITMTGEESDFSDLPANEYEVDDSACTYIRNKGILVFTDRLEHTVNLYNFIDNYATRCVLKDETVIKEPKGVCVGPDDCILVCSDMTHSIVQVSLTGKVISSQELDMDNPRSVCVNADGSKLVVSNCATGIKKLQLYDLHI